MLGLLLQSTTTSENVMCANYFVFDILLYRFKRNTYQDYGNEGDDGYIYDDGGYIYDENTRIVEGYDADKRPWMAYMIIGSKIICGGALVNKKY